MSKQQHFVEKYVISNLTDIGLVRESNQDYYGRYQGSYGELVIVCDGVGFYKGGEEASRIAVETIAGHFAPLSGDIDPKAELHAAINQAHQNIIHFASEHPDMSDLGTTAVVLLLRDTRYWIAWIGDSRIYLKRGSRTQPITKDHSYVQGLVDQGLIKPEEAARHPQKNIITRSLGGDLDPPDVKGPFTVCRDDVFLLCTDGLSDYFTNDELNHYLALEPQHACHLLVEEAKNRGGKDNITLQIVKANIGIPAPRQAAPQGFNWLKTGLIAASALVLLLVAAFALKYFQVWPFSAPKAIAAQTEDTGDATEPGKNELVDDSASPGQENGTVQGSVRIESGGVNQNPQPGKPKPAPGTSQSPPKQPKKSVPKPQTTPPAGTNTQPPDAPPAAAPEGTANPAPNPSEGISPAGSAPQTPPETH